MAERQAMMMMKLLRLAAMLALAAGLALPFPAFAQTAAPIDPAQKRAFEELIRDYILRNPEVIIEALEQLEQKRKDEETRAVSETIAQRRLDLTRSGDDLVLGNPQGDVTIVEFFDYRCPYCKQAHTALTALLREDRKVRLVLKELPILGPESVVASRAALASRTQGKYPAFSEALLKVRGNLDEAAVMRAAAESGLDVARLKKDMESPEVAAVLDRNLKLARELRVTGTPAFVIGDRLISGALDLPTLRSLVAEGRKG